MTIPANLRSLCSFFALAIGIRPASSLLLESIFFSVEYLSLNSLAKSITFPTHVELPVMSFTTFTPFSGACRAGEGRSSGGRTPDVALSDCGVAASSETEYLNTSSSVRMSGRFSPSLTILSAHASASGRLAKASTALGSRSMPFSPSTFRIFLFIFGESSADVFKYLCGHGWLMPDIRLVVRCFPTEDRARVERAITRLFPDAVVGGDDPIVAEAKSIEAFAEQLAKQRIRAAARKVLLRGMSDDKTFFRLNKQVAFVGKVSFSEEDHALGDMEVTVSDEDIASVIDELAPRLPPEGGS